MKTQRIYVLSAICLFAGLILFLIGFAMMGFNIMNFDTEPPYTSAIYDVKESIEYMYNELSQGHPVVLQVTQKRSNEGLRHLVTAVGYSSSVNSYQDLTPENILVLDCVDGKVQTLNERNRKLYNQGGKYQSLGPTEKFLASITPVGNTVNA